MELLIQGALQCEKCAEGLTKAEKTPAKMPVKLVVAAWFCVLLTPFLSRSFLWYIFHWATLGLGIALLRAQSEAARINGWIVVGIFALTFVLSVFLLPILLRRPGP